MCCRSATSGLPYPKSSGIKSTFTLFPSKYPTLLSFVVSRILCCSRRTDLENVYSIWMRVIFHFIKVRSSKSTLCRQRRNYRSGTRFSLRDMELPHLHRAKKGEREATPLQNSLRACTMTRQQCRSCNIREEVQWVLAIMRSVFLAGAQVCI